MPPADMKSETDAAATLSELPIKLYKLTTSWRRNPSLTPSQFHEYVIKSYGPKFATLCEKYGVVKYTQFHTPDNYKSLLGDYAKFAQFDVVFEILVKDLGEFDKLYKDPEYDGVITALEDEVFDRSSMVLSYGFETVFVEEGKALGEGKMAECD